MRGGLVPSIALNASLQLAIHLQESSKRSITPSGQQPCSGRPEALSFSRASKQAFEALNPPMIVSHACHHAFAGFFETGRMPQDLSRFLDDVALNKTIPTPRSEERR